MYVFFRLTHSRDKNLDTSTSEIKLDHSFLWVFLNILHKVLDHNEQRQNSFSAPWNRFSKSLENRISSILSKDILSSGLLMMVVENAVLL